MQALLVKLGFERSEALRKDANPTPQATRQRALDFIEVEHESAAVPTQAARTDGEMRGAAIQRSPTAFGHGPAVPPLAIERHVDADMVLWIDGAALSGTSPGVIG